MTRPTPKTLLEAIQNGVEELDPLISNNDAEIIYPHIKDFLSQHFQVFMLAPGKEGNTTAETIDQTAKLLWKSITGETL